MNPSFSDFHQVAYVTNDMARAKAVMAERYGVTAFLDMDVTFPCELRGEKGEVSLAIALANMPGVQIELILPRGGLDRLYSEVLEGADGFRMVFHHVAAREPGTLADWDARLASMKAAGRRIAWTGEVGPQARFVYTDDRDEIGHYIEYVWFDPENFAAMNAAIPFNVTKGMT